MPVGSDYNTAKTPMEQMREPQLPPQIRAMQLKLAHAKQRERDLEGQVKRLTTDVEALRVANADDRISPLNRRIQDLEREAFKAQQELSAARREASELVRVGAADEQQELAQLRDWKATEAKRSSDLELQLGLERQRNEIKVRELTGKVDSLTAALAKSEAQAQTTRKIGKGR